MRLPLIFPVYLLLCTICFDQCWSRAGIYCGRCIGVGEKESAVLLLCCSAFYNCFGMLQAVWGYHAVAMHVSGSCFLFVCWFILCSLCGCPECFSGSWSLLLAVGHHGHSILFTAGCKQYGEISYLAFTWNRLGNSVSVVFIYVPVWNLSIILFYYWNTNKISKQFHWSKAVDVVITSWLTRLCVCVCDSEIIE
jgi:hypothetical protein